MHIVSGQKKLFHVKEYLSPKDLGEKGLSPILDAMEVADNTRPGTKKHLLRYVWPDTNTTFEARFGSFIQERGLCFILYWTIVLVNSVVSPRTWTCDLWPCSHHCLLMQMFCDYKMNSAVVAYFETRAVFPVCRTNRRRLPSWKVYYWNLSHWVSMFVYLLLRWLFCCFWADGWSRFIFFSSAVRRVLKHFLCLVTSSNKPAGTYRDVQQCTVSSAFGWSTLDDFTFFHNRWSINYVPDWLSQILLRTR